MAKFRKHNLQNIKLRFEKQTGVELEPTRVCPRRSVAPRLIFAAVLVFAVTMVAFSQKLFTPLDGDALSLSGEYMGDGIVSICVENKSDKTLQFQEKAKLIRWVTGEEAERLGGGLRFENTVFPAHSSGTMLVDLSAAYDIAHLETAKTRTESYYLLLTNKDFLFGHDWICSFRFIPADEVPPPEQAELPASAPAEQIDAVEEELRFYFEETYTHAPLALNEAHFQYQQTVEEMLMRFQGNIVTSLSPTIMVAGPSVYLDPEPMVRDIPPGIILDANVAEEQQHFLTSWQWAHADGYGRLIATAAEQAMVQTAMLPQHPEEKDSADGGVALPLIFHMIFDADQAKDTDSYAFVYGQLLSFAQLEQYKVFHDQHYAIYDVTDLIYTDVDAYLDFFLTTRTDVYCDDDIRERVRNVYNYYQDKEATAALFYYRETK